jgi:hypothetical protein
MNSLLKSFLIAGAILVCILMISKVAWGISVTRSPQIVVDSNATGTLVWSDPLNATTSDNLYAKADNVTVAITHYLKATDFGFTIPAGSTINGIIVEIERVKGATADVTDAEVKIVKSDGTLGTTNKADTATQWPTTEAYKMYSTSTDLWNESWTSTDINDADFGMVIAASAGSGPGDAADIDHIRITTYYTENQTTSTYSHPIINSGKMTIGNGGGKLTIR